MLNPGRGHRTNSTTYVIVFVGTRLYGPDEIDSEAQEIKDENVNIIVIGVGSQYDEEKAKSVASNPDWYYTSDYFGNEMDDIAGNITKTLTHSFCDEGQSPTTTTTTTTTTTVAPGVCSVPDVVFLVDRSYFETNQFNEYVKPILSSFSDDLDDCVDIHTAYVEYSTAGLLRFPFDFFQDETEVRNGMKIFTVGPSLSSASDLGDGLNIARTQVNH